jgi:uncharacterized membrane protein YdjX (TVP38/TMEM64 family)
MSENYYFITCFIATERKPIKTIALLQFMTLPTVFKTYAIGLFKVAHWEYLIVTAISNFLWSAFWVYLGSEIQNIFEVHYFLNYFKYLEVGKTSYLIPIWLQALIFLIGIGALIYLFFMTKQIYEEIQKEALIVVTQLKQDEKSP